MDILFATQNPNKVAEIQNQLNGKFRVKSLLDVGYTKDLAETQDTLEGNALQKARYVYEHFKTNCFADDTGLEVEALNNAPGVYSARYAGPEKSADLNMAKLLEELEGKDNRKARFRTVIALIWEGEEILLEGICSGSILHERRGEQGFGYDPIFHADGYEISFAEMDMQTKNQISHRGLAVEKLIEELRLKSES